MLARLLVHNYALIEHIEVAFGPQLNILTGETGAGKSILVGAIGLILGHRADASVLLNSQEKCIVEAEFQVPHWQRLNPLLAEAEIALDGPNILLRREVQASGKSRALINDQPVTLNILRALTAQLVDLHGQHDGQQLLQPAQQLTILDQYGGLQAQVQAFADLYADLKDVDAQLHTLRTQEAEAKRQSDYYRYQLQELAEAALQPGEDERIETELKVLQHAEQIGATLARAAAQLQGDDQALALQLKTLLRELEKLQSLDGRLGPHLDKLREARVLLDDAGAELATLAEDTELNPARATELEQRLNVVNKLKLKFQARTVDDLLDMQAHFASQLDTYAHAGEQILQLEMRRQHSLQQMTMLGLQLENARLATAQQLGQEIAMLLQQVGLAAAALDIQVRRNTHPEGYLHIDGAAVQPNASGINTIEFLIRTNAGLPLGSLASIASGGEVSRVMLAIKTALAGKLRLATLIFDEIDTGISGETALKVGAVMQQLAQGHQVLTITHLPQIASRSGQHYQLYKEDSQGRASTRIRQLYAAERVAAVARMISGDNPTPYALQNARELLELA